MKKLLVLVLLASCTTPTTTPPSLTITEADTLLTKSEQHQVIAAEASKKSDSVVTGKIEHAAQKIEHLETQVEQLKEENHELKVKLDDATDDNGQPYSGLPVSPN